MVLVVGPILTWVEMHFVIRCLLENPQISFHDFPIQKSPLSPGIFWLAMFEGIHTATTCVPNLRSFRSVCPRAPVAGAVISACEKAAQWQLALRLLSKMDSWPYCSCMLLT